MPELYTLERNGNGWKKTPHPQKRSAPVLAVGSLAVSLLVGLTGFLALSAFTVPRRGVSDTGSSGHFEQVLERTEVPRIPRDFRAPVIGPITFGAFAAEAALSVGIDSHSTRNFADADSYGAYRDAVRAIYGADLEDMNYFAVGLGYKKERFESLAKWVLMAGQFGDVTLAIEPLGTGGYSVFADDNEEMLALKAIFERAGRENIKIWVRFASENNLGNSPYSVSSSVKKASAFYEKAKWFRDTMPENVGLVYSPLINTAITHQKSQERIMRACLLGSSGSIEYDQPWSRIGGTLYLTDINLVKHYDRYHKLMKQAAPEIPFQICELGGPYRRKKEILSFLKLAAGGRWEGLEKVNFFARTINQRADPKGTFGFIEPNARRKGSETLPDGGLAYPASFVRYAFNRGAF